MNAGDFKSLFQFLFKRDACENIAFIHPGKVTYHQIRSFSIATAEKMMEMNVSKGDIIAIILPNGLEFCSAFFGTILCGGTPMLVDPGGVNEIKNFAEKIKIAVTTEELMHKIERFFPDRKILLIDKIEGKERADFQFDAEIENGRLFTIFLTSGSTGQPREIAKTCGSVLGEVKLLQRVIHNATDKDVYLCAVPWFHIYGFINGFLLPLSQRAKIIVPGVFLPREIEKLLLQATVFLGVPIQYRAIVELSRLEGVNLRLALSSGAALHSNISERFKLKILIPVTEIYGSTEMGGVAVRKNPDEAYWNFLPGIQWKVMDDNELFVKTPFIYNDSGENSPITSDGWFPSGDCITITGDGKFILEGRKRGIIKVGGKRVSASEIEEAIISTGFISDVAVCSYRKNDGGDEKIAAIVVPAGELVPDRSQLRKLCLNFLEPYKVPDKFVFVKKIPRTNTGKVQIRAVEKLLNE